MTQGHLQILYSDDMNILHYEVIMVKGFVKYFVA